MIVKDIEHADGRPAKVKQDYMYLHEGIVNKGKQITTHHNS